MRVVFTKSFENDISKIRNAKVAGEIIQVIEIIRKASSLSEIPGIKKMKGGRNAFRIKIKDHRLGFYLEKDIILLSRVLDRKDIYKYFP